MREIRKTYLCGLGAIGGAYGSALHAADPDGLKVIAGGERLARHAANGVIINGSPIRFTYIQPEAGGPAADLILIAVKRHQLEQTIRDIRNFVGEHTVILSLLNGIDSEEIIGREYGMEKLLYSFVIGTDGVREDHNIRFTTLGSIVFGERENAVHSPKVAAVKAYFERTRIPHRVPQDMLRELWWKFMMNVGINQTSAILRATYGSYQKIREARDIMRMACMEVVRVAEKVGIHLQEEDIDAYFEIMSRLAPEGKTSMLQDIEAGRKTEVESFAGTVIELGRKYDVPTPVNEMLYSMIRTLEQMKTT